MSRPPYKPPAGGNRRIAFAFLAIIVAFAIIAYAVAFWPRDDDDAPETGSPASATTADTGQSTVGGVVVAARNIPNELVLFESVTTLSRLGATSD